MATMILTSHPQRTRMALGRMESFDRGIFLDLLKRSGKTQSEIAVHCMVTKSVVSHWVSGRSKPAPQHVPSLAEALDVAVLDLAGKTYATADLVDLRIIQGLHGAQAAELAGIKTSQIQTLEAAISMPKPEHLEALAAPYKTDVNQLRRSWVNRRIHLFGHTSLNRINDETRQYLSPWADL
ncbi:helix-turn-helix domain-containing protein [Corynebacterium sp. A21]|uniref:helix-turn-helix domain-containing protein n=1 Tax=Corynebacterium sp. A21 TaxID=3457318 RepID=UPI003FCF96B4